METFGSFKLIQRSNPGLNESRSSSSSSIVVVIVRAGFSLSRALFRKKCGGSSCEYRPTEFTRHAQ